MPKIELYQRRISIPGEAQAVPANIGAAGIVGESIADLGRTGLAVTSEIVNVIARRNEEMRKQNNAFAVLKAQNSIDADTRAFKQSYDVEAKKSDFDPGSLMKFTSEKTDAFSKELDKKYLSNIDDPDQKVRIGAYRNAAVEHVLDHTSVFQAGARKDFANNEVSKAAEMSLQDAREGTDSGIARTSMRLKIGELHASGYYSAAQAEDLIVKSDQQITVAYLDGLVALQPDKVMDKLKSKEYRQYLPEGDYRRLMEKAKTLNEKKIQEEKEMTAYVDASERWPDAKQAMVEVLKPGFMKKYKLTINQAQNIAQSFKGIVAGQKEEHETAITKIQNDFVTRAFDRKNPLMHSEIEASALNAVGAGSKIFFHDLVDQRASAIVDDSNLPYTTDNGKAIADVLLRNADPNQRPLTATEILSRVPKLDSYSLKTAEHLIKTMDVTNTDVFKNTDASLKTMFGYEGVLKGFGAKPLGAIYYNNAMTEILADLTKTPVKGTELRNRINELAEPYLKEYWMSSGETPNDIKTRLDAMGIKQSPSVRIIAPPAPNKVQPPFSSGSVVKRKPNETIGEYLKRTGM